MLSNVTSLVRRVNQKLIDWLNNTYVCSISSDNKSLFQFEYDNLGGVDAYFGIDVKWERMEIHGNALSFQFI